MKRVFEPFTQPICAKTQINSGMNNEYITESFNQLICSKTQIHWGIKQVNL